MTNDECDAIVLAVMRGFVIGEQVRTAVVAAGIDDVRHHDCSICGEWVFYFVRNGALFFNSGCGCSWSPPRPCSWDEAADWINMQSEPETRERIALLFGIGLAKESP